jgi:hypothetical protein
MEMKVPPYKMIVQTMIRNYYLARKMVSSDMTPSLPLVTKGWSISFPSLFGTETDNGLYLQTCRDTQFSYKAKKGEVTTIYLLKTNIGDIQLHNLAKTQPGELLNNPAIQLVKVYHYVCDPDRELQDGLQMEYFRCDDGSYDIYLPDLRLPGPTGPAGPAGPTGPDGPTDIT